jgi:cytochrome c peroxidase
MSPEARKWFVSVMLACTIGAANAKGLATANSAPTGSGCVGIPSPECARWQSHILPDKLPVARGNAYADRDDAAALGMRIFYDNRFSKPGSGVSGASCHVPEHSFSEDKPRSDTIAEVARNAPDLIDAAWYAQSHFWDGKVDNLWSAPLFTFEQDSEMGSTRLHVVHVAASVYKQRYEGIFGAMPDMSDRKRFPDGGKPGSKQFDAMSERDKLVVNQVYANVGKALEAYLRKLAAGQSPLDDVLTGSGQPLTAAARRGMTAFNRYACDSCHSGSAFTDESFHDLSIPEAPGRKADSGRAGGAAFARNWEFSSSSRFADDTGANRPQIPAPAVKNEQRAFRTPSLRNVALTFPYGHDGRFDTLEKAIDAHVNVLPGHHAPDARETSDIVQFLHTLNGRPPQSPWKYWPGG